jgi:hypothetical protein
MSRPKTEHGSKALWIQSVFAVEYGVFGHKNKDLVQEEKILSRLAGLFHHTRPLIAFYLNQSKHKVA